MTLTKSKEVVKYLYRYATEKSTSELVGMIIPFGSIGLSLWEMGNAIYDIISSASEEDRQVILSEIQSLNENDIESEIIDLIKDPSLIQAVDISVEDKTRLARGIYQSLRQIPHQNNNKDLINNINRNLFNNQPILSIKTTHPSKNLGAAIVKTLLNTHSISQTKQNLMSTYPKINGFEIKGLLGEGAYARVFLAKEKIDEKQERLCALKVGVLESQHRFMREVNNMKTVKHKNVLTCWNAGFFEDQQMHYYWISMPNMRGFTLGDLMIKGELDLKTKLLILIQIAEGIEALHSKGIIHRDLKPNNCLISNEFEIKISDFGLSKNINKDIDSSKSQTSHAIGTPAYMSPEQIDGNNISYATDVWAFGMIAYEIFKGDLPWGRHINALVMIGNIRHLDIDIHELQDTGISFELMKVIEKCLRRNSNQRYKSGIELKRHIDDVMKNKVEKKSKVKNKKWIIMEIIVVCMMILFLSIFFKLNKIDDSKNNMNNISDKPKIKTGKQFDKSIEFIKITGGSFMMGSTNGEKDWIKKQETPVHQVNIKDFYVSKTEITVAQYQKCVEANVCSAPHWDDRTCWVWKNGKWTQDLVDAEFRKDHHPVVCVNWTQAREYAQWIGGDLLSEAQWEYASRSGGKDHKYPWGNAKATCDFANFNYNCHEGTIDVCLKTKGNTEQGLCDMAGNALEWVLDEWHDSYEGAPSNDLGWCSENDCNATNATDRIFRGGSWRTEAVTLRNYLRSRYSMDGKFYNLGFRVAKEN